MLPLRVAVAGERWALNARTVRHRVEVEAESLDVARVLPVPVPAEGRVVYGPSAQHLAGSLRLTVRRGPRTVFAGTTVLAGLEHGFART